MTIPLRGIILMLVVSTALAELNNYNAFDSPEEAINQRSKRELDEESGQGSADDVGSAEPAVNSDDDESASKRQSLAYGVAMMAPDYNQKLSCCPTGSLCPGLPPCSSYQGYQTYQAQAGTPVVSYAAQQGHAQHPAVEEKPSLDTKPAEDKPKIEAAKQEATADNKAEPKKEQASGIKDAPEATPKKGADKATPKEVEASGDEVASEAEAKPVEAAKTESNPAKEDKPAEKAKEDKAGPAKEDKPSKTSPKVGKPHPKGEILGGESSDPLDIAGDTVDTDAPAEEETTDEEGSGQDYWGPEEDSAYDYPPRSSCVPCPPGPELPISNTAVPAKTAASANVDLVILIDGSRSVERSGVGNFRRAIDFARDLTSSFVVSPRHTRVGLMVYGKRAYKVFGFNDYRDNNRLFTGFNKPIRYPRERAQTATALRSAYRTFFGRNKRSAQKVLVLVTDGKIRDAKAKRQSQSIKRRGVKIYVVGAGKYFNIKQLEAMASRRPKDHVFTSGWRHLGHIVSDVKKHIALGAGGRLVRATFRACGGCGRGGRRPGGRYPGGYRPRPGYRPWPRPGYRPWPRPGRTPGRRPGYRPGYIPPFVPGIIHPGRRPGWRPGGIPGRTPGRRPGGRPGNIPPFVPGLIIPSRRPGKRPGPRPGIRPGRGGRIPKPAVVYPLNGITGARDVTRRPNNGRPGVLRPDRGPDRKPSGAKRFLGNPKSYIIFPRTPKLRNVKSITISAWVKPLSNGPIFHFNPPGWGVHVWIVNNNQLFARFVSKKTRKRVKYVISPRSLRKNRWSFIAAAYNNRRGVATLSVNGFPVISSFIGPLKGLATNYPSVIGSKPNDKRRFRGSISCVQIFKSALNSDQLRNRRVIRSKKCFRGKWPLPVPRPKQVPTSLVAFYPLDIFRGGRDLSYNRAPTVILRGVRPGQGPGGIKDTSFVFYGRGNSYGYIPTSRRLDISGSITIVAYINHNPGRSPRTRSGPIVDFRRNRRDSSAVRVWMLRPGVLYARFGNGKRFIVRRAVPKKAWTFIGAVYKKRTGRATLYVNGYRVASRKIGRFNIARNRPVSIGSTRADPRRRSFRGKISCLQIYRGALSSYQIRNAMKQCHMRRPKLPGKSVYRRPTPVIQYPLDSRYHLHEYRNRGPIAFLSFVRPAPGPDRRPHGSYELRGEPNSYIKIPRSRGLDVRGTMTVGIWVYPKAPGPILKYNPTGSGFSIWFTGGNTIMARFFKRGRRPFKSYDLTGSIQRWKWNFISATYDRKTRYAVLYVNGRPVSKKRIPRITLATNYPIIFGVKPGDSRRYRGRVSCFTLYKQPLTRQQIRKEMRRCFRKGPFVPSRPKPRGPKRVVAVYPLDIFSRRRDTARMNSPARFSRVRYAPGPDGRPGGSVFFRGSRNSYITFPNHGQLDTDSAITMTAWIYPGGRSGPIANFHPNAWKVHWWLTRGRRPGKDNTLFVRFQDRSSRTRRLVPAVTSPRGMIKRNKWYYVATTYDKKTGVAQLFVNNRRVGRKYIGRFRLATNYPIRMGARISDRRYYRGRISCFQVFNYALSPAQIKARRRACFRKGPIRPLPLPIPRPIPRPPSPPLPTPSGPYPRAFFPLSKYTKGRDIMRKNKPAKYGRGVRFAPGPFRGTTSTRFLGRPDSYLTFPNTNLDTKNSLTILAYVYPEGKPGPIFNYNTGAWGAHFWAVGRNGRSLFARITKRAGRKFTRHVAKKVLVPRRWQLVAVTYSYTKGRVSLYRNGKRVSTQKIGQFRIATNYPARMGVKLRDRRYFKGRVACLQIFSSPLTVSQMARAAKKCRKAGLTPLGPVHPLPPTRPESNNPVAVYPLNRLFKFRPLPTPSNRRPPFNLHGRGRGVSLDYGPDGKWSAYKFYGRPNSYIEIPNLGALDTVNSISILTWIRPENRDGPIVNYHPRAWGVHFWVVGRGKLLFARLSERGSRRMYRPLVARLKPYKWQYVGFTFDRRTRRARLYINNRVRKTRRFKRPFNLATNYPVRVGAKIGDRRRFKGKISCLQFYNKALSARQVRNKRRTCFSKRGPLPRRRPVKPAGKVCRKSLDLAFLVDSSGSIRHAGRQNYPRMKRFIQRIIGAFNPRKARISVTIFSNRPRTIFSGGRYRSIAQMNRAVLLMPYFGQGTYTGKALRYVANKEFRRSSRRIRTILLLTDGKPTDGRSVVSAVRMLKQKRVTIISVGVGNRVNTRVLRTMASNRRLVFRSGFSSLSRIASLVKRKICTRPGKKPKKPKVCRRNVDVSFVVDSSSRTTSSAFNRITTFITRISSVLSRPSRMSVVSIQGRRPVTICRLRRNGHRLRRIVRSRLRLRYAKVVRAAPALYRVRKLFNKSSRKTKVVVFLGTRKYRESFARPALLLKRRGINMITIGVNNYNSRQLRMLATSKKNFIGTSSRTLKRLVRLVKRKICRAPAKMPTKRPGKRPQRPGKNTGGRKPSRVYLIRKQRIMIIRRELRILIKRLRDRRRRQNERLRKRLDRQRKRYKREMRIRYLRYIRRIRILSRQKRVRQVNILRIRYKRMVLRNKRRQRIRRLREKKRRQRRERAWRRRINNLRKHYRQRIRRIKHMNYRQITRYIRNERVQSIVRERLRILRLRRERQLRRIRRIRMRRLREKRRRERLRRLRKIREERRQRERMKKLRRKRFLARLRRLKRLHRLQQLKMLKIQRQKMIRAQRRRQQQRRIQRARERKRFERRWRQIIHKQRNIFRKNIIRIQRTKRLIYLRNLRLRRQIAAMRKKQRDILRKQKAKRRRRIKQCLKRLRPINARIKALRKSSSAQALVIRRVKSQASRIRRIRNRGRRARRLSSIRRALSRRVRARRRIVASIRSLRRRRTQIKKQCRRAGDRNYAREQRIRREMRRRARLRRLRFMRNLRRIQRRMRQLAARNRRLKKSLRRSEKHKQGLSRAARLRLIRERKAFLRRLRQQRLAWLKRQRQLINRQKRLVKLREARERARVARRKRQLANLRRQITRLTRLLAQNKQSMKTYIRRISIYRRNLTRIIKIKSQQPRVKVIRRTMRKLRITVRKYRITVNRLTRQLRNLRNRVRRTVRIIMWKQRSRAKRDLRRLARKLKNLRRSVRIYRRRYIRLIKRLKNKLRRLGRSRPRRRVVIIKKINVYKHYIKRYVNTSKTQEKRLTRLLINARNRLRRVIRQQKARDRARRLRERRRRLARERERRLREKRLREQRKRRNQSYHRVVRNLNYQLIRQRRNLRNLMKRQRNKNSRIFKKRVRVLKIYIKRMRTSITRMRNIHRRQLTRIRKRFARERRKRQKARARARRIRQRRQARERRIYNDLKRKRLRHIRLLRQKLRKAALRFQRYKVKRGKCKDRKLLRKIRLLKQQGRQRALAHARRLLRIQRLRKLRQQRVRRQQMKLLRLIKLQKRNYRLYKKRMQLKRRAERLRRLRQRQAAARKRRARARARARRERLMILKMKKIHSRHMTILRNKMLRRRRLVLLRLRQAMRRRTKAQRNAAQKRYRQTLKRLRLLRKRMDRERRRYILKQQRLDAIRKRRRQRERLLRRRRDRQRRLRQRRRMRRLRKIIDNLRKREIRRKVILRRRINRLNKRMRIYINRMRRKHGKARRQYNIRVRILRRQITILRKNKTAKRLRQRLDKVMNHVRRLKNRLARQRRERLRRKRLNRKRRQALIRKHLARLRDLRSRQKRALRIRLAKLRRQRILMRRKMRQEIAKARANANRRLIIRLRIYRQKMRRIAKRRRARLLRLQRLRRLRIKRARTAAKERLNRLKLRRLKAKCRRSARVLRRLKIRAQRPCKLIRAVQRRINHLRKLRLSLTRMITSKRVVLVSARRPDRVIRSGRVRGKKRGHINRPQKKNVPALFSGADYYWSFDKADNSETKDLIHGHVAKLDDGAVVQPSTERDAVAQTNKNGKRGWINLGDFDGKCFSDPSTCEHKGMTVMGWFKLDKSEVSKPSEYIMSTGGQTTKARGFALLRIAKKYILILSTKHRQWKLALNDLPNEWFNLAFTWEDKKQLKLFVNGELKAKTTATKVSRPSDSFTNFYIGRPNNSELSKHRMALALDDLALWEKALTKDQIREIVDKGDETEEQDETVN